jgi:signal transduction histidine kinase
MKLKERYVMTLLFVKNKVMPFSIWIFLLVALYLTSFYNYLLFHSLAEEFALVITVSIFLFTWNARDFMDNNYLLFIGIAFLFVAILDALHTFSYKGIGVFTNHGSNLPTQLWIAGRYLQSASLFVAPFFLGRKLRVPLVFFVYFILDFVILASIFVWHNFPIAYIEGFGLTSFKRMSEYIISILLLASLVILLRHRKDFPADSLNWLLLAIVAFIGAELGFASYESVYSNANLYGHLFRIVSFIFIYKAILEIGLHQPYQLMFWKLKKNEQKLWQKTIELQSSNMDLDAYAHTVAHDLKNPIASQLITIKALENPDISREDALIFLNGIGDTARGMNEIVDGLLLLAEIRKANVIIKKIDMAEVFKNAEQRLIKMIQDSKAEIKKPTDWPEVLGYALWIEEIWANYLSNAIKYGGKPPQIQIGWSIEANQMIKYWVQDNGIGVPEDKRESLFKPFSRLSVSNIESHGLGLSIVKRIIDKLNGQVGVEDVPGSGSRFYFMLPSEQTDDTELEGEVSQTTVRTAKTQLKP